MWKGYKSLVTEIMPKAQVVADRFHVMVQINKELDMQRKKEKRTIEKKIKLAKSQKEKLDNQNILAGIVASKYSLLKNEKELNPKQKDKLVEVRNASPTLRIMHQLKEKFREIFEKVERWADGLIELGGWLSTAQKYFVNSQSTIVRWLDEILAYFDNRTTSGVVEGINTAVCGFMRDNSSNVQTNCEGEQD